ncbi:ATP-binding protein, partial [Viscerimonas tarda]
DEEFLDKARVTLDGKITNTAILLLGKSEASALLSPAIGQITWVLKDAPEGYEHFYTPFILTVNKTLACIRNLKYRYMIDDTSLFPNEVTHYDEWVIREALNNAVAHQDYSKSCRIIVLEYNDRLIFENAGSFIPESVEDAIHYNRPQPYYRNPFLVAAMVNLNMIDTVGSGIKKMFTIQRDRFFPLPTYNISDEKHTEVTIHGELINENYSRQLFKHPELSLDDVIALDKVQKKLPISKDALNRLRSLDLIKGRSSLVEIVGSIKSVDFTNKDFKEMVLNLLREKGSVSREEIEKLIMPFLPQDLPVEKKQKKISNVLVGLSSKDKKIRNISQSIKFSVWELNTV